jgi:ATP phosphoribosyltransferase regulatory subunit
VNPRDASSRWMLPAGVFEMPPRKAGFIRATEDRLLGVFGRAGYSEVRTPAMEYLEAMARGVGEAELDIAMKFVDRDTGRMMVLRSDITPQVARMAALAMAGAPRPLRLCYVSEVYRYPRDPSRARRELIQAGAELIGVPGPAGDAEALALAVSCLRELGFTRLRFSLGQVLYARAVLGECGLDRDQEDRLLEVANRKDAGGMDALLSGFRVPRKCESALRLLAGLAGSLEMARKAAPNPDARRAVDDLERVIDLAVKAGVDADLLTVDLGDLATFHYHTGAVFTGFVAGVGGPVAEGGRYDDLIGRYGSAEPATGFAIDILELTEQEETRNG